MTNNERLLEIINLKGQLQEVLKLLVELTERQAELEKKIEELKTE